MFEKPETLATTPVSPAFSTWVDGPHEGNSLMTPQMQEARRLNYQEDIRNLRHAGLIDTVPQLLERAAWLIGAQGWWKSSWGRMMQCNCIWSAIDSEIERFSSTHPKCRQMKGKISNVILEFMLEHFELSAVRDLFELNDKQPDHEGQGWAIYHLNTLAKQFRVRHRLQTHDTPQVATRGGASTS